MSETDPSFNLYTQHSSNNIWTIWVFSFESLLVVVVVVILFHFAVQRIHVYSHSYHTKQHNTNAICRKAWLHSQRVALLILENHAGVGFFFLLSFFLSFNWLLEQEPDPPPTLISRRTLPSRCLVAPSSAPKLAGEWRRDFRQPHGAVIKRLMTAEHFACSRGSSQRRRNSLSYLADERG